MTNSITENKIMIFVEADSTPGYLMTRCIPFSVICFLSQSGMNSDGYCRGYVSFAHFCYIVNKAVAVDIKKACKLIFSFFKITLLF